MDTLLKQSHAQFQSEFNGDGRMEEPPAPAAPPAEPQGDIFAQLATLRRLNRELGDELDITRNLAQGAEDRARAYARDIRNWIARALRAEQTADQLLAQQGRRYVYFAPVGVTADLEEQIDAHLRATIEGRAAPAEQRAEAMLRRLRSGVMGHTTDMIWQEMFIVATAAASYFEAQREIDAVLRALESPAAPAAPAAPPADALEALAAADQAGSY